MIFLTLVGIGTAMPAAATANEVTPQRYIRGVCGALSAWIDKTLPVDAEFSTAIDALQVKKLSALTAKAKVVALYATGTRESDKLVVSTDSSGVPNMRNGWQLKRAHARGLTEIRDVYRNAGQAAAKLSTSDTAALYDALEELNARTNGRFQQIGMPLDGLRADATLHGVISAEKSCAPVIAAYRVSVDPTGFKVGDCVNYSDFGVVGCNQPHDAEVYVATTYPRPVGTLFPGSDAMNTYVDQACTEAFGPYVGMPIMASKYTFSYIAPDAKAWAAGDREIICGVSNQDDYPLTGSAKGIKLPVPYVAPGAHVR